MPFPALVALQRPGLEYTLELSVRQVVVLALAEDKSSKMHSISGTILLAVFMLSFPSVI